MLNIPRMIYKNYILVVFASFPASSVLASFIDSSFLASSIVFSYVSIPIDNSLTILHEPVSGETLKCAIDTCKALVNTVEYEQCMKDQSILSVELIEKASKVKDDEIINYEELTC